MSKSKSKSKPDGKTLARLRAILKTATLAAIASTAMAAPTATASTLGAAEITAMPDTNDVEILAHQLAARLTQLPAIDAVGATAELATSGDVQERLVLAGALAWVFPLASDDILLQHLADDPDPRVRAATARAAWARQSVVGDTGILRRLLADSDPDVRSAAWLAVRG